MLPARAGKGAAADYVRQHLAMPASLTVVAGDSMNDLLALAAGTWHVGARMPWGRVRMRVCVSVCVCVDCL